MRQAASNRKGFNRTSLRALELRTNKPYGTPREFRKGPDRDVAVHIVESEKPFFVIGSPQCTAFSPWNVSFDLAHMNAANLAQNMAEGELHPRFMIKIYTLQLDH